MDSKNVILGVRKMVIKASSLLLGTADELIICRTRSGCTGKGKLRELSCVHSWISAFYVLFYVFSLENHLFLMQHCDVQCDVTFFSFCKSRHREDLCEFCLIFLWFYSKIGCIAWNCSPQDLGSIFNNWGIKLTRTLTVYKQLWVLQTCTKLFSLFLNKTSMVAIPIFRIF